MKLTRIIAVGLIAATSGVLAVHAKSLKEAEIPAEFPPASYKGKQYVDSRGCVYIRAGIDGMVNWVPRVNRDRDVLCGYQPSLAKPAAPEPDPNRTAGAEVIEPATEPARAPAAAKPAAKPAAPEVVKPATSQTVAKAAPKPRATAKPAPRTVAKAAPKKVVRRTAKAAPATKAPVQKRREVAQAPRTDARNPLRPNEMTTCSNVSGESRYYAGRSTSDAPVRCGPQSGTYATVSREPVTVMRGGKKVVVQRRVVRKVQPHAQPTVHSATVPRVITAPVGTPRSVLLSQVGPNVRLVPKHVWIQQQEARLNAPVPKGYRKAWDDDRLNTKRAHMTKRGIEQSRLAWTRTVPRKLYVRDTGLVVTQLYPGLKYPYYSYDEMRAAGYDVPVTNEAMVEARADKYIARANASGKIKRVQRARVSTKQAKPAPQRKLSQATRPAPKAATRKAAKVTPAVAATAPAAVSGGRFVQVGMFGVAGNAQKAAARLEGMGLPARINTMVKGGKRYDLVSAGPFTSAQIGLALSKARRAGFRDAYIR